MALVSRAAAVSIFAVLALASPAFAGPPGTWTQVTNFSAQGSSPDEVTLARTPNGVLNILWTVDTAVQNTQVSANATNVLGTHTVFNYENGAGESALLKAPNGTLRAFFSGLDPGTPHDVGLSTATSPDGVTWTVQPTRASQSNPGGAESPVYAATGMGGTFFTNGVPLAVWGDSAPGAAGYHIGTSDGTADVHFGGSSATVASPNAATDSADGTVAIGWNDLDTGMTLIGFVQATGLTTPVSPPNANAIDGLYPVQMTGRSGGAGGIWVAYLRGDNPFTSPIAIWQVGSPDAATISKGEARYPGVTMGPGGRLWAFWEDDNTAEIHARRSNADANTWGAEVTFAPPGSTTWSLKGEGSAVACGALDVVALATKGDTTANYQQRVLAGLDLKKKILNGRKGKKQKVRFKTLDAGDPVDATVKFGKKRKATGADGKVKFKIKRKKKTRKVKAKATDECYAADQLKVKVKKLLPALQ